MASRNFQFNIPITKVDEEKRLVYGLITEEIVDGAGEILDYEGSKKYFEAWSDGISKVTGGASVGNLRLMHQPVIAGKLVELIFDDVLKQISCVAKIVSDEVWELVKEGCLTGFSMGGKYVKRWKDAVNKAVTRFIARPVEVSVVDNPCVSTATFEYVKADGSTEVRKFHIQEDEDMEPTQEQIAERALELAKAAGTPDAADSFMDEARTLLEGEAEVQRAAAAGGEVEEEEEETEKAEAREAAAQQVTQVWAVSGSISTRADAVKALVQVWRAPDGSDHLTKDEAIDHVLAEAEVPVIEPVVAEETPVDKALRLAREAAEPAQEPAPELADLADQLEVVQRGYAAAREHLVPLATDVSKGLYEVRSLASVIQEMSYLVSSTRDEAAREGDNSAIPAQLFAAIRQMGTTLVAMAQEEVAELLTQLGAGSGWADAAIPISDAIIVECAELADIVRADTDLMEKAGARHSAADMKKIQGVHDHAVALGASCEAEKTELTDTPPDGVDELRAENERLGGEVEKAVAGIEELGQRLVAMQAELDVFKKTPAPLPARTDPAIMKRLGLGSGTEINQETIEKMSPDERVDLAIRLSQLNPVVVGG